MEQDASAVGRGDDLFADRVSVRHLDAAICAASMIFPDPAGQPQSASKRALNACSRIASACALSAIAGDSSQPSVA